MLFEVKIHFPQAVSLSITGAIVVSLARVAGILIANTDVFAI